MGVERAPPPSGLTTS